MIELHNIDCMEYLATCEDNAFELAIVDPPYGIGYDVACAKNNGKKFGGNTKAKRKIYHSSGWDDKIPDAVYFFELKRVSKNQIIWGWNYFLAHLNEIQLLIFHKNFHHLLLWLNPFV